MNPNLKELLLRSAPPPVHARHVEYSLLLSMDDEPWGPTTSLLTIALEAAKLAQEISLECLRERTTFPPYYAEVWPGEHYRLLAALVSLKLPKLVLEIGTGGGLSALAMRSCLPQGSRIITFDIDHWSAIPGTVLRYGDFEDGSLTFLQDDLASEGVMERHRSIIEQAELIFLDAAKDGSVETQILANLTMMSFNKAPILVLDDIRLWNMLKIWRDFKMPKLDLTSFGHWSGTGLVEWQSASLDVTPSLP